MSYKRSTFLLNLANKLERKYGSVQSEVIDMNNLTVEGEPLFLKSLPDRVEPPELEGFFDYLESQENGESKSAHKKKAENVSSKQMYQAKARRVKNREQRKKREERVIKKRRFKRILHQAEARRVKNREQRKKREERVIKKRKEILA